MEYFSEGRSRTGRLLQAKAGMLAMTIQAMLRGSVALSPWCQFILAMSMSWKSAHTQRAERKRKEKEKRTGTKND